MKFKNKIWNWPFAALLLAGLSAPACAATGSDMPASSASAEENLPELAAASAPIVHDVAGSYLSSRFARASGNLESSVVYLRKLHQRQPENISIALQLQGTLLMQGKVEEAARIAEDMTRSGHSDPLAELVLALRMLRSGHADDADQLLRSAQDNGNQQLWLPLLLGWVNVDALDAPLTMAAFSTEVGHAAPLVNYHLALINAGAGYTEDAARNFLASIEAPAHAPPRIMHRMRRFYEENGEPPLLRPLMESRRQEGLEEIPTPIQTPEDGIAEVLYTMGGIMFGAGVVNDAAIYMQLAAYIKPDFFEALMALGDAFTEMKQWGDANVAYARVTADHALYSKAQLHIAVNDDRMGKRKEALALLDKLHKRDPSETDAIVTKGDLYRIHSRYQEAIGAYTEALKQIPEPGPDDWPILFARGSCLERLGKWPEAEADLKAALALKPDQPDILNYLGFAQIERGQNLEGARDMIAQAVEARPNDAQIVDSMGWVLYKQGDYEAALTYLEKAVELLPSDPTVNDHLGDVYWQLGRKTEARFQWNRAISYSPEQALLEAIQKKLKDGLPVAAMAHSEKSAALVATR